MKTIRISEDFFNEEKTKSIGGCYFEATMDDLSYCNMQINIRELDCLTEEIKEKIKENFNDFIDSIFKYGWNELLEINKKNESTEKIENSNEEENNKTGETLDKENSDMNIE